MRDTEDMLIVNQEVIGSYPVRVHLVDGLYGFDILPKDKSIYNITVCDLSIPFFIRTGSFFGMGYYVDYLYRADDISDLILWRLDDEGENWYDYTADANIYFNDGMLSVTFFEPAEHTILLT